MRESTTFAPALRDADAILARATEDEAAALAARDRYLGGEMERLEPDPRVAGILVEGENVYAVRRSALLDRRAPQPGPRRSDYPGLAGDLYVTASRLLHVGRFVLEYELDAIRELSLSGERLLVLLGDGTGLILDVDHPRLLRVEIAALRARRAAPRCPGTASRPASPPP